MTVSTVEETETDVLVIGSGAAGLYASLCAARHGRQVTLLTKSRLNRSSSAWAQGGIAAAIAPDDSPHLHLQDTLSAGRGLSNEQAAAILTREAPACIRELEALGLPFDQGAAGPDLGQEGGHSRRRILHAGGSATGDSLVRVLIDRVMESELITVGDHTSVERIVSDGERCVGVIAVTDDAERPRRWRAPVTILATGGAAGLYSRTTNPPTAAGDGVALAYEAGADVMDMEFMQFHPTALNVRGGRAILISEAVRGEGAQLINHAGVRFMPAYHELAELAPRDVVTSAIYQEMTASGTDHVFLTLASLTPEFITRRFPNIYEACLTQGIDITRDPVPVAPAAHYSIGGVWTDIDPRTSLDGLWACGEVAATGVHGANRLASNSLLECLVFAARAVTSAVHGVPLPPTLTPDAGNEKKGYDVIFEPSKKGYDPFSVGRLMTEYVGVVRNGEGLRHACAVLDDWERAGRGSRSRLLIARLMAQGALLRAETRGAHVREDYPEADARWLQHIVFRKGADPRCLGA